MKKILIAGAQSGAGKTTGTIGLMAALVKRGMRVQGFKVGPDFLDPTYYRQITGRAAHNLDGWMTDKRYVRRLFLDASLDADISIIEGVMGLYDGFGAHSEDGSSAQIAKWLDAPVILVVNARGMGRSACAVLKGFMSFDKRVKFAGVLFNNLGSERHLGLLREAVAGNIGLPVFGGLLKDESLRLPERYLGLHPATEGALNQGALKSLASQIEKHVDLDAILDASGKINAPPVQKLNSKAGSRKKKRCRIGVARDEAFSFYYEENFRLLEEAGAELIFFSPIRDQKLPEDLGGIYLGGGYPEIFADRLASNGPMRNAVLEFAEEGKPVYAECGGLMYLSRSIQLTDGNCFPMAGVFPFQCGMLEKRKALGYVEARLLEDSILGEEGMVFRGHEFHYSTIENEPAPVHMKYSVTKRAGEGDMLEGFSYKNVLGSYIHAHFGSQPGMAGNFVGACKGALPLANQK
ncbi:MAG: cobyrinate a,c-diamide synthase [Nitrospinae bacterium]|nr:cobyrinate a,c-diamide synthase [Nitrospinota bacterium]